VYFWLVFCHAINKRRLVDCTLNIARNVCCLIITLGVQCDMVDFELVSVAGSIGISSYTCYQLRQLCTIYHSLNEEAAMTKLGIRICRHPT